MLIVFNNKNKHSFVWMALTFKYQFTISLEILITTLSRRDLSVQLKLDFTFGILQEFI